MNAEPSSITIERYLAADLHKQYVVVGGMNAKQEVVLQPRRVELDDWPRWATKHLRRTDAMVVEATTNTWDFHDQVKPLVGRVVVANSNKVKLIAQTRVKTDKQDVLKLARLLVVNLIPEVWVPPHEVRELRSLVAHTCPNCNAGAGRRQLVKNRTMLKNRLHSVLHRHHLMLPNGDPFADKHRAWWDTLPVSATERLHLRHDLATLAHLAPQIAKVEEELGRLSTTSPWAEQVTYLLQLPGVGLVIGTLAPERKCRCDSAGGHTCLHQQVQVGDIQRFEDADHLVGYAGLGASVHDSGQTHRTGRITKQGRKDLRWVLVEAAWVAVEQFEYWKQMYQHLCQRMASNKAIVAIARHLLVAVWHVLSGQVADKHADPKRVAVKLMRWSWSLSDEQRGGLTSRQFIRYHLMRLKLGKDLTHITYGNMPRRIASVEEVLALQPELRTELSLPETES